MSLTVVWHPGHEINICATPCFFVHGRSIQFSDADSFFAHAHYLRFTERCQDCCRRQQAQRSVKARVSAARSDSLQRIPAPSTASRTSLNTSIVLASQDCLFAPHLHHTTPFTSLSRSGTHFQSSWATERTNPPEEQLKTPSRSSCPRRWSR